MDFLFYRNNRNLTYFYIRLFSRSYIAFGKFAMEGLCCNSWRVPSSVYHGGDFYLEIVDHVMIVLHFFSIHNKFIVYEPMPCHLAIKFGQKIDFWGQNPIIILELFLK